jgi:hypothetical protein
VDVQTLEFSVALRESARLLTEPAVGRPVFYRGWGVRVNVDVLVGNEEDGFTPIARTRSAIRSPTGFSPAPSAGRSGSHALRRKPSYPDPVPVAGSTTRETILQDDKVFTCGTCLTGAADRSSLASLTIGQLRSRWVRLVIHSQIQVKALRCPRQAFGSDPPLLQRTRGALSLPSSLASPRNSEINRTALNGRRACSIEFRNETPPRIPLFDDTTIYDRCILPGAIMDP